MRSRGPRRRHLSAADRSPGAGEDVRRLHVAEALSYRRGALGAEIRG